MPTTTPLIKINRTKNYGAEVVLFGNDFDEACEHAYALAAEKGYTFVHPFDDPDVAAGQGSIAMEIIKELPTVDYILVPVGGGGLCAGVATLAKLLNPKIKVIAVEPSGAACLQASLKAGKVVNLPAVSTIADGTAVHRPGEKLFPLLQENVDDVIVIEASLAFAPETAATLLTPWIAATASSSLTPALVNFPILEVMSANE